MLKQVLKYDLRHLYKFLLPLYLIVLLVAITARACGLFENSFLDIVLGSVLGGIGLGCAIAALTNNIVRCWTYFRSNLYGDQGYLTNTLPLTKGVIYAAKFLTAIITILTSSLLLVAAIVIIYGPLENFSQIWSFLDESSILLETSSIGVCLIFVSSILLEVFCVIEIGFFGIILGQRAQNTQVLRAVIYGAITFFALQAAFVALAFLVALFNPAVMSIFNGDEQGSLGALKTFVFLGNMFYLLVIVGLGFANVKLLNRGIDLE